MNYINSRPKKLPVILEADEMQKLISIPNTRYLTGIRNKAILKLMLNCGLRVSEITKLRPSDINLTAKKLRITDGKGGVDRDLNFKEETANILKAWKQARPKGSQYFFTTIKDKKAAAGKDQTFNSEKGKQLSTRYIQFMIKRYAKKAGIEKDITPHTLRHSYATFYIRQAGSVLTLQRILGHAYLATTLIYVHLANKDVEEGMNGMPEI